MPNTKISYIVLFVIASAILFVALHFQAEPKVSVSKYNVTDDNTNYPYKYTLKHIKAKKAAELLQQASFNQDYKPSFDIKLDPLKQAVKITYNEKTNTLYFSAEKEDYNSIVKKGLSQIDKKK